MEIFKLFGSIFVKTDDAQKSISKAEEKTESFASKLGNGITTAAKWGTAIVGGAAAVGTALVGLTAKSAGSADEVDKMSAKIGLSKRGYQEWSYVMGQNGMEIDKLQTGMKTLVSQMDASANGTRSAQENFDKLGLSIYDESGKLKDQEIMMNEVMVKLADMENGTEKARLATELFGKSGSEMMPMLNQGSDSMKGLTERAHELGLIMSDETVSAGVELGDLMDDVKQSVSMLATNLGTALFPILKMVCETIIANMPMIQSIFASLAPVLASLMDGLLPPLLQLAGTLLPMIVDLIMMLIPVATEIIQAVIPIMIKLLNMLLPPILEIVQKILPLLISLIEPLLPLLNPILQLLQPLIDLIMVLIDPLIELLNMILPPLIDLIVWLTSKITDLLMPAIQWLADKLQVVLIGAINFLIDAANRTKEQFKLVGEFFKNIFAGDWSAAWSNVKQIFSNWFDWIKWMAGKLKEGAKKVLALWLENFLAVLVKVKDIFKDKLEDMKATAIAIFDGIKDSIKKRIEGARDFVKDAINKIKSFLDFKWSLPTLKMPHFSINGSFSLNPPSVPSLGIDWYAKAMNDPMIMNSPTAFGVNSAGQLMVGGERGSEVVAGTETLISMIASAVEAKNAQLIEVLYKILNALQNNDSAESIKMALAGLGFEWDGRELARLVRKVVD